MTDNDPHGEVLYAEAMRDREIRKLLHEARELVKGQGYINLNMVRRAVEKLCDALEKQNGS